MAGCREITLLAQDCNIPKAVEFIEEIMVSAGFASSKVLEVELAVEETCANIINHAYPEEKGSFRINSFPIDNGLMVEIEDEGLHFDPTLVGDPNLSSGVEERPIGGLGIHLIKSFVHDLKYEFIDGKNILMLIIKKDETSECIYQKHRGVKNGDKPKRC